MQKHVNLVDLVKSFPTNIYLQNLASIQKRMSPVKFAHLAEKSGKGSISNLSAKVTDAAAAHLARCPRLASASFACCPRPPLPLEPRAIHFLISIFQFRKILHLLNRIQSLQWREQPRTSLVKFSLSPFTDPDCFLFLLMLYAYFW